MKLQRARLRTGLLAALLATASAAAAEEPPCTAAEHRQFDFWVGSWEVTTEDGVVAGTNNIRGILNGCALEESWRGAQGSIGKSLNMYFARDGKWHQSWVDGSGFRLDLAGGLDERGRMVLSGLMPGPDGGEVLHEISWEKLANGNVQQHWRASKDTGETWQDVFKGTYRPTVKGTTGADGRD